MVWTLRTHEWLSMRTKILLSNTGSADVRQRGHPAPAAGPLQRRAVPALLRGAADAGRVSAPYYSPSAVATLPTPRAPPRSWRSCSLWPSRRSPTSSRPSTASPCSTAASWSTCWGSSRWRQGGEHVFQDAGLVSMAWPVHLPVEVQKSLFIMKF